MNRADGREFNELRAVEIERGFPAAAPASVLIRAGRTTILCTASVAHEVPPWRAGQGKGWITAEYSMLPGSTRPRKPRPRGDRLDGRASEIQRLIGRSLRAVADLELLGERTITVDCDVLEADGGTRTLSVTGGLIALVEALQSEMGQSEMGQSEMGQSGSQGGSAAGAAFPLRESVAAVSAGIVGGQACLDLDYQEDAAAAVDMNVVVTGSGRFVEIQGTGEEATFSDEQLQELIQLAKAGSRQLVALQRAALGSLWPW